MAPQLQPLAAIAACLSLAVALLASGFVAPAHAGTPKGYDIVTCGSAVKLKHKATNFYLHSQDVAYGSGSGQQSVTIADDAQDYNDLWQIRGTSEKECKRATKIKCGSTIRLRHVATDRWLHSHTFKSPLSQNQEVSAYGDYDKSDSGDYWNVECEGKYWGTSSDVRFKHVDTNQYLHSTGKHQYNRPIHGQREVCAYSKRNNLNTWSVGHSYVVKPIKKQS